MASQFSYLSDTQYRTTFRLKANILSNLHCDIQLAVRSMCSDGNYTDYNQGPVTGVGTNDMCCASHNFAMQSQVS